MSDQTTNPLRKGPDPVENHFKELTLETLAQGAAGERFDHAFRTLLANVQDPNTDPRAKRKIALTLTIQPDSEREQAGMSIDVKIVTAPVRSVSQPIHLGMKDGKLAAVAFDPKQGDMFGGDDQATVSPITSARREATKG